MYNEMLKNFKYKIRGFKKVKQTFEAKNIPIEGRSYGMTVEGWKFIRDNTECGFADWTDSELEAYDKKTGYIGTKQGIKCFIYLDKYFI